ncbi:VOC family protein [Pseudonocardia xishanensis]|uniref:VOC family protein n=1 Tax=Pseudonocardia xishanensis TaxID=630995 RepID=A0ABP8RKT6_9PSEU
MTDTPRPGADPSFRTLRPGVTGEYTTDGVPHGSTSLTPFLAVTGAAEAIAFYRDVFGARLVDSTEMGGVVVHADLDFGHGRLQLGEPSPAYGLVPAPEGEDTVCYSIGLYCPDVDALVARAEKAGATIREPVTDFVSGDRFASIRDPFGVRWSIMSRVEDLSEAESAKRVAEWAAAQSG